MKYPHCNFYLILKRVSRTQLKWNELFWEDDCWKTSEKHLMFYVLKQTAYRWQKYNNFLFCWSTRAGGKIKFGCNKNQEQLTFIELDWKVETNPGFLCWILKKTVREMTTICFNRQSFGKFHIKDNVVVVVIRWKDFK